MKVILRGMKNAFRNTIRTVSVTLILALSIGLALVMLLSYQTVTSRIAEVKKSVGNTITVNPAGVQGFQGGGEPLTEDQMTVIAGIDKVVSLQKNLQDRLTPSADTNLVSAIDAGTLGNRFGRQSRRQFSATTPGGQTNQTQSFTIPITVTGISDPNSIITGDTKLASGTAFAADSTENVALVGSELATKNNLSVDSTFTAYNGTSIKVVGIFDAGNQFRNTGLYMPIKTLQTLSDQTNQITSATVTASDIESVDTVVQTIKDKLGSDKVDVTSNKDAASQSLAPLENIKNISLYSLIGALVAGAVITLLIMMMIVRERRREIGVLKAIGSSNIGIVTQFVSESLLLTLMGSVIGAVLGILLSNPVLSVLVNNSASSAGNGRLTGGPGEGGFMRFAQFGGQVGTGIRGAVTNLQTHAGLELILYGFLAALAIAVIGSAVPAWIIAKVKPAEVMRAE
jgi:putative ABC transport system permease protein